MANKVTTAKDFQDSLNDLEFQGAHVAEVLIEQLRQDNHKHGAIIKPFTTSDWLEPEHAVRAVSILNQAGWQTKVEEQYVWPIGQSNKRVRLTLFFPQ